MNIECQIKPRSTAQVNDFSKVILQHRDRMIQEANPDSSKPGLFFATLTFKDHPQLDPDVRMTKGTNSYQHYDPAKIVEVVHGYQSNFYYHLLGKSVPSFHYPKRRKHYPVSLSFMDLKGSKFSRSSFLQIPHTHSVLVVPSKTLPKFEALANDRFGICADRPKTKSIKTIDCQKVAWQEADISRVLDYSSKFYRSGYAQRFPEDVRSLIFSMYG